MRVLVLRLEVYILARKVLNMSLRNAIPAMVVVTGATPTIEIDNAINFYMIVHRTTTMVIIN